MGKLKQEKRNNAASSASPYAKSNNAAKSNNVFKFNTDFGQHILKNPGGKLLFLVFTSADVHHS